MSYQVGEKVCFSEPSSGSKRWDWNNEATYAGGPFYMNLASKGEVSHMLLSPAGHHFTCPDDRVRPAPPEPEWEYLLLEHQEADEDFWTWGGYPGYGLLNCHIEDYDHVTRRQVGKPETVEVLTREQVEGLRND